MTRLKWDQVGERYYESGVDRGVLYIPNATGVYALGVPWNGLTGVSESPSGAEASAQYADNMKYLNLVSAEDFGATVTAFTYPDLFAQCDGTAALSLGVNVGQQARKTFGLAYRTKVGNDTNGVDHGYKIHLVYGCLAAPSAKEYATINESPEALTLSWELTTTPVEVPNAADGKARRPTAVVTVDSTKVDPLAIARLEAIIYGKDAVTTPTAAPAVIARLPLPAELVTIFA